MMPRHQPDGGNPSLVVGRWSNVTGARREYEPQLCLAWFQRPPTPYHGARTHSSWPAPGRRLSGAERRADPPHPARGLGFRPGRRGGSAPSLDVGRLPGAASGDHHCRYPLRHEVEQARHRLDRGICRYAPRPGPAHCAVRHRVLRRWVHDQSPARRRHGRQGLDRAQL